MADDSWDIQTTMDFHPCDSPHGMKDYILSDLTEQQQTKLNVRKIEDIRNDQMYLANHPEIRGLITMILRRLLQLKPRSDICDVIGQYFVRSSVDIKEEIYAYLDERENILSVNSTILEQNIEEVSSESLGSEGASEQLAEFEAEELLSQIAEMEEAEIKKEEADDDDVIEHLGVIRWESSTPGEEDAEVEAESSVSKICDGVLQDILKNVFEELDAISLGSIVSVGFPEDYQDHHMASDTSVEGND